METNYQQRVLIIYLRRIRANICVRNLEYE